MYFLYISWVNNVSPNSFPLGWKFYICNYDKNRRCGPTRFVLAVDPRTTVLIREREDPRQHGETQERILCPGGCLIHE